ncbi:hypothetical protein HMPREF9554_00122 [Treponema phagedenis F0421]|nr:hypothetical protein HMPREF9554_00122 [Treponema phagedenis F0421]
MFPRTAFFSFAQRRAEGRRTVNTVDLVLSQIQKHEIMGSDSRFKTSFEI